MRPIYKSMIMTFIVSLPAFLFMSFDLYSYYCQPLKKLENVPAELAVIKNSRGVRYELGMIVYINEKKVVTSKDTNTKDKIFPVIKCPRS